MNFMHKILKQFHTHDNQSILFLATGAIIGIAMSTVGFIEGQGDQLPDGVIARVNNQAIGKAKYQQLIAGFSKDRKRILTDGDRSHILERLIEEELLIQRGIELGLLESDTVVRSSVVRAMIQSVIEEASSEQHSQKTLKSFYKKNIDFFTVPLRLRVRQIVFRQNNLTGSDKSSGPDEAYNKAMKAYQAMKNGMTFDTALRRFGDILKFDIPDVLLPPSKIREYIGPTLTRFAQEMRLGEISPPLKSTSGYRILFLADRISDQQQTFERVKKQVETEFRKRRDDQALRNYLERLKNWADIKRGSVKEGIK